VTRLPLLLALLGAFFAGMAIPRTDLHAQPAEAALDREADVLAMACRIEQEETYDFHGTEFFALTCHGSGRAVLSIDGDLPLARWLRGHHRQIADLELRPHTLQRVDR
jgi:hypothetical protein